MYEVSVKEHFDAAHYLVGYGGKCENVHGHRFRVVATLRGDRLDERGLVYDFAELRRHLREVVGRLDHVCLNDVPPFDHINPSSENIAATVYGQLKEKLGEAPLILASIQVWESPEAWATYTP